jgi:hypothetical protein
MAAPRRVTLALMLARGSRSVVIAVQAALVACAGPASRHEPELRAAPAATPTSPGQSGAASDLAGTGAPQPPPQIDPDGNDDEDESGVNAELPEGGHFERVGTAPLALQRICDLTALGDALYAAHANSPLGSDGATITRYRPSDAERPFHVAFDWNRPGEPSKGGGAGQGFLRVRKLGTRLFVPDSDPPYLGFWMSKTSTEGFVYITRGAGEFARARRPGYLPPLAPRGEDSAGAGVLTGAFHVLDVIRYRGHYYASTGSLPPGGKLAGDSAPGALHVASDDLSHWDYAIGYPGPTARGVWRLTFLVRFRDRLYAGLQAFDREPHDYVVFEPPKEATSIAPEHMHARSVTGSLGTSTYRWYADRGRLFWIARTHRGVELLVSGDGDEWRGVELPADVGAPTDVVRFGKALVILAERALLRLDGDRVSVVARVTAKRSPFELTDYFCAAPLAVFQGELYAGGQRGGALYKLAPGAESASDPSR